jgi:hypothetical protein
MQEAEDADEHKPPRPLDVDTKALTEHPRVCGVYVRLNARSQFLFLAVRCAARCRLTFFLPAASTVA